MPGWAQEGLAEMFATAKLQNDGSVIIGDKNDSRGSAMFGMNRWSVRRLLASDLDPPKGDEGIEAYSRGWALIHYLWMSGERPGQYTRFIAELNKGTPPIAAGEAAFGDLDTLNTELNRYINRHKYNLSEFSTEELGEIAPIAIRPLGADEAAILRSRIASSVGVNEKTSGPLAARARPIGARFPDSVSVQTAMAEILHDAKDYDGADAAADRVLAREPDNLLGLVYKGRVAVRRAIAANDNAAVASARSWFRRAARAHQDQALAYMLYYDSFTALGETPPADAIAALYRAVVLVPQDTSLRVRAALSLIREGNVNRARSILAPAAFSAEAGAENKALKLMQAMDDTEDPQALLAKAAELKLDKVNDFIEPPKDEDDD
jgi:tetratricopeptide (TPR) repeat protein